MAQPPAAASSYSVPGPSTPTRRRAGRWVALAVVLIVAVGVGAYFLGRSQAGSSGSGEPRLGGAPHGPSRLVDGVPAGYTRDRAGAATAAVNAVQASLLVSANKLDPKAVVAQIAAPQIDAASKRALATVDHGSVTNPRKSLAFPLLVQTDSMTTTAAHQKVLFTEIDYGQGTQGSQTGLVQYFFATVHLVWTDGDWKVAGLKTRYAPGPAALSSIKQPRTQRFVPWPGNQFTFFTG